jgi:hypothetical protein
LASKSVTTGAAGRIRITVDREDWDVSGNFSIVSWSARLEEDSEYNFSFSGSTSGSVVIDGDTEWSGTFSWDWRPGGLQDKVVASGSKLIQHASNGTKSFNATFNMGATGTGGAGGPTSVTLAVTLPTLTGTPSKPTGLTATRISDTQTRLDWDQSSPSNSQPTTNTIQQSVNGGAWTTVVTINDTETATVSTAANRKTIYRVRGNNSAGSSDWSTSSAPIYTTPAAPFEVTALKNASLDIVITFDSTVAYSEHTHELWHGTVSGGVVTWDGAALASLPSGTETYTHTAPSTLTAHIYRVRSKAGALSSAWVESDTVALLAAPNKPTTPAMPQYADKAAALSFGWTHNSVDTTPQKSYEVAYSTNGGTTWSSAGKINSTTSSVSIPANVYAANTSLTMRVRTWGSATGGGADGTGASPWSDLRTVTYKTAPVATITDPANGSTVNDAELRVDLGFAQAEGGTFVGAEIELVQAGVTLEELDTGNQVGNTLATPVENDGTYTVRARVQDSWGLWSAWVSSTFDVEYLTPVTPGVAVSYLADNGYGQIYITVPEPGAEESAAETITVIREINGEQEYIVRDYPTSAEITLLDTTPTINGTNTYRVTVTSALGAQRTTATDLVTTECRRAFLSKGAGFTTVGVFGANLEVDVALGVASQVIETAGRVRPIGLYGVQTSVVLKVGSWIIPNFGSTIAELEALLLVPGRACYRDASGRRVFGAAKGSIEYRKVDRGEISFTLTETS